MVLLDDAGEHTDDSRRSSSGLDRVLSRLGVFDGPDSSGCGLIFLFLTLLAAFVLK